ncbi:MAG: DUF4388 domain-containing protein, partial [Acidimicrobiales bacterium]
GAEADDRRGDMGDQQRHVQRGVSRPSPGHHEAMMADPGRLRTPEWTCMPLQGSFDVLNFAETLRLVARQQLTGRLHVRSRNFAANLFFEDGALTGADQSEHQAAANAGDVRGRLEEICFGMLDSERGTFEFQPGRASSQPEITRHKVETVLGRARKRLEEWHRMQEFIPSLEVQPRLVTDLDRGQVTLDQERWRMLTAVDGRRNLRAIGRILNLSDFDVCRVLKGLLDEGVVDLEGRAAALAAPGRDTLPTVAIPDVGAVGSRPVESRLVESGPDESVIVAGEGSPDSESPSSSPLRPSVNGSDPPGTTAGPAGADTAIPPTAADEAGAAEAGADPNADRRGRRVVRIRSRDR